MIQMPGAGALPRAEKYLQARWCPVLYWCDTSNDVVNIQYQYDARYGKNFDRSRVLRVIIVTIMQYSTCTAYYTAVPV
jgi:hypothetical protein